MAHNIPHAFQELYSVLKGISTEATFVIYFIWPIPTYFWLTDMLRKDVNESCNAGKRNLVSK